MNQPKVALAHVNVAPFVQHAARAFYEHGMLDRFLTTLTERPCRFWQRSANLIASFVKFDLAGQLKRRAVSELPQQVVHDHPWQELARLAIARMDRTGVPGDLAHEWMETGFDRWVSRSGIRKADIVYGYENVCYTTFKKAGLAGLYRIYDAPAPEYRFSRKIIESEVGQNVSLETAYQRHIRQPAREYRRDGRRQGEYAEADLIVTASSVTRDSFASYFNERNRSAEANKLVIIPYGAPPPAPTGSDGGSRGTGPVRLLWAGTFSIRKGARYLVDAIRQLQPSAKSVKLDVYGRVTVPREFLIGLPDSVRFHGSVSREQLTRSYRASDLLLFPTLCDGFGMVATEALAQGLPVLTTPRAGACDLIKHHINGIIVPPANTDSLASSIEWSILHRAALAEMRSASLETAARWQWSDYRQELVRLVCERYWAKSS